MTPAGSMRAAPEEPQEVLEERAHHFAQPLDSQDGDGDTELFLIPEGVTWLGLPLPAVSRLYRAERWARVPFAPAWCHGLVNLRGEIVAVVDLAAFIGLRPRASLASPVLGVVVEAGETDFLVPVEGRTEIASIRQEGMEAVPRPVAGQAANLLRGLVRLEIGLVLVVDLERAVEALKAEIALLREPTPAVGAGGMAQDPLVIKRPACGAGR